MKLTKFAKLVKKTGRCLVVQMPDATWLSNGCGIYRADGLPKLQDKEQVCAVLDVDRKTAEKITVKIKQEEAGRYVAGMDLDDGYSDGEKEALKYPVQAVKDGMLYAALETPDGNLTFYDQMLLLPVADVIQDSEYINFAVRENENVGKYIVVKDGMETVAAIMPCRVLDLDYVGSLESFWVKCSTQLQRERQEEVRKNLTRMEMADSLDELEKEEDL